MADVQLAPRQRQLVALAVATMGVHANWTRRHTNPRRREYPLSSGESLTARERDVLQLVADGVIRDEIAERLNIGRTTVNDHLYHAFRKLGARSAIDAIRSAVQQGVIDFP